MNQHNTCPACGKPFTHAFDGAIYTVWCDNGRCESLVADQGKSAHTLNTAIANLTHAIEQELAHMAGD